MPGAVLYAMGSPFRRLPRVEYVYGAASGEGLDPVAALLDDNVFDNIGLVFVADIYSVWPEVGVFPRATGYSEVVSGLEGFMSRRCGIRLSPRLCRRIVYRVVPWRGVMGGWRFTGGPGDALAYMVYGAASLVSSRRVDRVYVVLGEDEPSGLAWLAVYAGLVAAAAAGASLSIVAAEPRPFPAKGGRDRIELTEVESYGWETVVRLLIERAAGVASGRLLVPRTPRVAGTVSVLETGSAIVLHRWASPLGDTWSP
ncbi:hypothetical protein [Hyperthermus butylicus]|uniref:hypothetical protein n=1 Tax=Hyperthermus butylicus TaxID=54248 RepID=UPI00064FD921|nr:hypothetical protein [Hyperthermus butylicus]